MLNQTVIVGRLTKQPELVTMESGKKVTNMTLAVPRSYKNENGEYETDFIDCTMWGNVAEKTCEYCNKGDLLGVKGRIQTDTYEVDGKTKKSMQVVVDRVTFLSNGKSKDQDKDID